MYDQTWKCNARFRVERAIGLTGYPRDNRSGAQMIANFGVWLMAKIHRCWPGDGARDHGCCARPRARLGYPKFMMPVALFITRRPAPGWQHQGPVPNIVNKHDSREAACRSGREEIVCERYDVYHGDFRGGSSGIWDARRHPFPRERAARVRAVGRRFQPALSRVMTTVPTRGLRRASGPTPPTRTAVVSTRRSGSVPIRYEGPSARFGGTGALTHGATPAPGFM